MAIITSLVVKFAAAYAYEAAFTTIFGVTFTMAMLGKM